VSDRKTCIRLLSGNRVQIKSPPSDASSSEMSRQVTTRGAFWTFGALWPCNVPYDTQALP